MQPFNHHPREPTPLAFPPQGKEKPTMGYEVKIYAGYLGSSDRPEEPRYMHVVGMVDLCKVSDLTPAKTGEPVYFFYEADGEERTTEDKYGDKLIAIPAKEMLANVKKASRLTPDYRRWKPAIALLESLTDFEGDSIYCVIYGY
jgi:hypothetical protein